MPKTIHSAIARSFTQDYLARFNACRASLRNLILLSEKLDDEHNKGLIKKLENHFNAVEAAFKMMEVKKPENKTKSRDENYIQRWIEKDSEVPDDYGEK